MKYITKVFSKSRERNACLWLKKGNFTSLQKINYLKELTKEKANSTLDYTIRRIRRFKPFGMCFVCGILKATCKHHIFQLQHNGHAKTWNMINICDKCHRLIHPWLNKE